MRAPENMACSTPIRDPCSSLPTADVESTLSVVASANWKVLPSTKQPAKGSEAWTASGSMATAADPGATSPIAASQQAFARMHAGTRTRGLNLFVKGPITKAPTRLFTTMVTDMATPMPPSATPKPSFSTSGKTDCFMDEPTDAPSFVAKMATTAGRMATASIFAIPALPACASFSSLAPTCPAGSRRERATESSEPATASFAPR
mmetsp:Transcript_109948/g.355033  ORF Transcript_109948/g.355033 Transcript_109948/m.355033 type:complete len:205 (-) Transcript_109948:614-1228(-)